jgi:enoyl-CoA hydratase/carnithine racemase
LTDTIELHVDQGIATVYLNRPEKRNAFSDAMREHFIEVLMQISQDKSVRAMVLSGRGKGFCAGGDVAGMRARLQAPVGEVGFNGWSRQQRVHLTQSLLYNMPKPTIAAVHGAASGLGADTALACDFIMGAPSTKFCWSYIHRALIPDGGGMYFLPRRVGVTRAKELIFSGRTVLPEEAVSLGIIDRMASESSLVQEAIHWATELSHGSATALALGKSILNQSLELSASQVFAMGSQAQGICYSSTEHRQSVEAFLAQIDDRRTSDAG